MKEIIQEKRAMLDALAIVIDSIETNIKWCKNDEGEYYDESDEKKAAAFEKIMRHLEKLL